MAKRRPTGKTPNPSKPTRQERRRAARDDAKAQQTVETSYPLPSGSATASPLTAAISYSRQDVLAFLALGLLVVVPYLPAMLWGGFVWDDRLVTNSEPVQDISGLWKIWFSPGAIGEEGHYWPLVYTTFWLEHKLWGYAPAGYHVVNVLLHLANTLLLWHLLRRLAVPGAWMVAAVFAVHPLHVESVAWVIERKDVLSGLFYFAAVLMWLRFVEQPNSRRYAWSLALYAAAMLSKSIAITLPAAFLIWHWWKQGRVTSVDLLRIVPFCVVGLVITVGDLSFYWLAEAKVLDAIDYSLTERTLIAARALWFYAGKLLWPTNLAVIYPLWDIRVADPLAWGYCIAAVALVVALWRFQHRIGRGPLAGALFFAVTLLPVLGFVEYGYMQYAFVADRFQYLAGIGVMVVVIGMATYGVGSLPDLWQKGALGVAVVTLVVLGVLTWRQANIYRDDETLHRHIIALNPQARDAHLNLGIILYNQARHEEALDIARVAVEQRPDFALAHVGLGAILNALGRFEEAETHLRRAIALDPQEKSAHFNLGNTLREQGRYEEALEAARVAVEQRPDYSKAHANLGAILNELGHSEEAEAHLRRALALDPRTPKVHLNLGMILYSQGRYEEALEAARVAVEQRPDYSKAHANLGLALNVLGYSEEAKTHLRHAIALNPQNVDLIAQAAALAPDSTQAAELYFLMGETAQENGQSEAAAEHYVNTLELDPYHAAALHWLATLRAEQQRYDEMLALLQRLLNIDPSDAAIHSNIGIALVFLGRNDAALKSFDRALSLDPTLENARANREALLEVIEENRQ